jgi:hypothetical protein
MKRSLRRGQSNFGFFRQMALAVVRQIVALAIRGSPSTWRKLFGLEWQADSSPGERCLQTMSAVPRQGFKKKRLVIIKWLSNLRCHRITMV